MQSKLTIFVAAALGMPSLPCAAQEVADFYKGKQIAIVVGFTPGGSSSLYAQALARHMGRYLPGSPNLIVQHVPGAGGLVAANNVYNTAPRDGTTFAITGRTVAIEPLLGSEVRCPPIQLDRHRQCRIHDLRPVAHRKGEDAAGRPEHGSDRRRVRR
jgi:tripartite-type tricarboxylate transporter receptor subunit TctC